MEYPICGSLRGRLSRHLLEQAPRSPEYVPDPIELEDHVPVYIPKPEHPEDLVPAEDEAPTPPLPPFFLSLHTSGDQFVRIQRRRMEDRLRDGQQRVSYQVMRRERLSYEQESNGDPHGLGYGLKLTARAEHAFTPWEDTGSSS
ncbi:hypothetical protein Tco_1391158 [Tanacetum coccineum]